MQRDAQRGNAKAQPSAAQRGPVQHATAARGFARFCDAPQGIAQQSTAMAKHSAAGQSWAHHSNGNARPGIAQHSPAEHSKPIDSIELNDMREDSE